MWHESISWVFFSPLLTCSFRCLGKKSFFILFPFGVKSLLVLKGPYISSNVKIKSQKFIRAKVLLQVINLIFLSTNDQPCSVTLRIWQYSSIIGHVKLHISWAEEGIVFSFQVACANAGADKRFEENEENVGLRMIWATRDAHKRCGYWPKYESNISHRISRTPRWYNQRPLAQAQWLPPIGRHSTRYAPRTM